MSLPTPPSTPPPPALMSGDDAWTPFRSIEETDRLLTTTPGSPYEVITATVEGKVMKVYKNLWASAGVWWRDVSTTWATRQYLLFSGSQAGAARAVSAASNLHPLPLSLGSDPNRLTYEQTHARVLVVAEWLRKEYGVRKGDKVGVLSRNYPEWIVTMLATYWLGAIMVAPNAWLEGHQQAYCLSLAQCRVVIVDPERYERLLPHLSHLYSSAITRPPAFKAPPNYHEPPATPPAPLPKYIVPVAPDSSNHNPGGSLMGVVVVPRNGNGFIPAGEKTKAPWRCEDARRKGIRDWEEILSEYASRIQREHTSPPELVHCEPDDDAVIMFTSGTTGMPKAVLSSHRAYLTNIRNSSCGVPRALLRRGDPLPPPPTPDDPQLGTLVTVPLFHVTGNQSMFLVGTTMGNKLALMYKWDVKTAVKVIMEENITAMGGVPFMAKELIESKLLPEKNPLISIGYGGAAPSKSLIAEAKKAFPLASTGQAWGLTESNSVAVGHVGEDYLARPTSTGLVAPVNDIIAVDPVTEVEVPRNAIGELWIRGPNMCKGYYRNPEGTAKAFTSDGWFKTGDLGSIDDEGFVYIRDRAKDIIIRGGENIASIEIENAALTDPRLIDAAAVPLPHPSLGEVPALVVVPADSAFASGSRPPSPEEVRAETAKHLPKHCVPVFVVVKAKGESLPRNANGKVVKKDVKEEVRKLWEASTGKAKSKL